LAEFRVAQRLAETTKHVNPESVEVFELFEADRSLPRVAYILGAMAMVDDPSQTNMLFYGFPVKESLPTLVHPNELLDGALTCNARHGCGSFVRTWNWMNNAVLLGLLREHGKRVNFLGVILQRTRFGNELGHQVATEATSQMARLLGANGVIITASTPSGNSFMDTMLTVQACERKGVKTVLLAPEWGTETGALLPLHLPEATAVVSSGSWTSESKLPAPDKVIGVGAGQAITPGAEYPSFYPASELRLDNSIPIASGIDWLGHMCNTSKED
jgi:glycine reductase